MLHEVALRGAGPAGEEAQDLAFHVREFVLPLAQGLEQPRAELVHDLVHPLENLVVGRVLPAVTVDFIN
ncbi:hypothetical protein GCM10007320_33080 [Pseudorhodoferax aquiterrae]|uniref:Uncharacterized protein n=1 Tax=Pseudorhodoferax aquiterrae TaxID=747304 RepID=A0ABQ3G4C8_9BURK|nr:hypothetical protein GCM10007320_33080 [Pseudorhodoferax aquiterrae]